MRGLMLRRAGSRRVVAVVSLGVLVGLAVVVARVQTSSAAVTTLATFSTRGTYKWTVPTGVTSVTFDVYGASGGGVLEVLPGPTVQVISSGGAGGEAKAKFAVQAGQVFQIVVGGQGGTATLGQTTASGGSNGGGAGSTTYYGGGGGGASDVRIGGRTNICAKTTPASCGYPDRIVVGGGGGGGSSSGANGAAGGGANGGAGMDIASGGKQTSAGFCESHAPGGGFGVGGPGSGVANEQSESGGGGAGWYGGCGGGGGSGYISHFSLSGSFPGGTEQGDGKVIITTT